MAGNFDGTYEVPGFERRNLQSNTNNQVQPQILKTTPPDVIVISSDEEEYYHQIDNDYSNDIKIETKDTKVDLPIGIFDPTAPSTSFSKPNSHPNPYSNPNVTQRSTVTPNNTLTQPQFRTFAAKSTAPVLIPNAKTPQTFTSEKTAHSFVRNRSLTPNERESVFGKQSTPESGFVDQVDPFDDYDAVNEQVQIQPNALEFDESSKAPALDTYIANLIYKTIADQFHIIPKKEINELDDDQLLEKMRSCSSSSSTSMVGSESDSWSLNEQQLNRKRLANEKTISYSNTKRRKQVPEMSPSSESYRPSSSGESDEEEDDDYDDEYDDDLESTFSKDTEPLPNIKRKSPQYEPESDSGTFTFFSSRLSICIYSN